MSDQGRVRAGTPGGGQFATKTHDEVVLDAPLVQSGPDLEVGRQYIITYEKSDEGGTELRTMEIVYAGDRGPFITSDDDSMIRRDVVVSAVTNDPYEKATVALEQARSDLQHVRLEKVAGLVRAAVPRAKSITFDWNGMDHVARKQHSLSVGGITTTKGKEMLSSEHLPAETEEAVSFYLGEYMAERDPHMFGSFELDLNSGEVELLDF